MLYSIWRTPVGRCGGADETVDVTRPSGMNRATMCGMNRVLLEICCGSLDDALEAGAGGADRVELCSCLFFGGLTPSLGTIGESTRRLRLPVIVMIRPRGGGFCYTEPEFAAMTVDAEAALAHGAAGIVFGVLTPDGAVDRTR